MAMHSNDVRSHEMKQRLRADPFTSLRLCLSDGRSVLIRCPDQAAVSQRMLFVGVTKVERSRPSVTPSNGDIVAKDWMLINLLQITAVEPTNGFGASSTRKRRKR